MLFSGSVKSTSVNTNIKENNQFNINAISTGKTYFLFEKENYILKIWANGTRRWYPGKDPGSYIEFGTPETRFENGEWRKISLKHPVKKPGSIEWNLTDYKIRYDILRNKIKFNIRIKNNNTGNILRWKINSRNLLIIENDNFWNLFSKSDSRNAGKITHPFIWRDKSGELENYRYLKLKKIGNHAYMNFDLQGLQYPVDIDPTFETQPAPSDGKDTYLSSDNADTNYGSNEFDYAIGREGATNVMRALIEFNLSNISSGYTCSNATLSLYCNYLDANAYNSLVGVYELRSGRSTWVEGEATWNDYASGSSWTTGGADSTTEDRLAASIATFNAPASSGNWINISLNTTEVEDWFGDSNENYGLIIIMDDETTGWTKVTFRSSDYTSDTSLRPKLVVDYSESTGNSVPVINQVQCEINSSSNWHACSDASVWDSEILQVRVNCTDTDSQILNVTYNLSNVADSDTKFSSLNATSSSGDWWYFDNSDYLVQDSGLFNLDIVCNDGTGSAQETIEWITPWGILNTSWREPVDSTNVSKNRFTTFSSLTECFLGECGDVNITLDPIVEKQPDAAEGKDTQLSGSNADTNYGSAEFSYSIGVNGASDILRALIEFNLSEIPSGSTCNQATLSLYSNYLDANAYNDPGKIYELRSGRSAWVEGEATWNDYASGSSWTTGGADSVTEDRLVASIATFNAPASSGNWVNISLNTTDVEDWFGDSNENYGLIIIMDDETTGWTKVSFRPSDYAADVSLRPKITINYTEAADSGIQDKGFAINTTPGAVPFWTSSSNPQQCVNLKPGDACQKSWDVNATGKIGDTYRFYVISDPTTYSANIDTNESDRINITIESEPEQNSVPWVSSLDIENPVNLLAASNKTVYCQGTINDADGHSDITGVNATLFNSGPGLTESSPDNRSSHYTNTSCSLFNQAGNSLDFNCTFDLSYFAVNGTWQCNVTVIDSENAKNSSKQAATINELLAISIDPDVVDYGDMNINEESDDFYVNFTNYGNVILDLEMFGYADAEEDNLSMDCDTGSISNYYQRYALTELNLWQDMSALYGKTNPVNLDFNLSAGNQEQESVDSLYWKLKIPYNTKGTCSGKIVFTAVSG
ncbi:DNRLRE domain-containing protein [Candidatus Woesearchaeota archaeon]|nr:DNRLRE domain-containing protein [Candidatus Woesearchaeota archaeon]